MLYSQKLRFARAPGIRSAFNDKLGRARDALGQIRSQHQQGRPYLTLPARTEDLPDIRQRANTIRAEGFTDIVLLGTGGSSLGAKALIALAGPHLREPDLRVHVPDNLGAALMEAVFAQLDMGRTHFIAVSKSGSTAETVAQLIAAYQAVSAAVGADRAPYHFTLITEPGDRVFRRLAQQWSLKCYDHDPHLGGRFSVLSLVGLLPAALAGIDIEAVRRGADQVLNQALQAKTAAEVPAAAGAAFCHVLARDHSCNIMVMMAYEERLGFFTRWWGQLWAESLGKDGLGTTPVPALGPVDQHSQVQLYLDGPQDKVFTIIKPVTKGAGPKIFAANAEEEALDYLADQTIGSLVDAEADATAEALARRGRPVRLIELPDLTPDALGGLLMHFMLETVLAAHLSGVNAFDQPAVEEGKVLTREGLRAGRLPDPDPGTVVSKLSV